jgi:hypothetical protein
MPQLNIHLTPAFERALRRLMRLRGITVKSEAVRLAVEEAAERASRASTAGDLSLLRGVGKRAPENARPRFRSEDDLWS